MKKRKVEAIVNKLIVLCSCCLALTGCATGHWDYGAMPREEAMKRAYDCQYMANMQAKGTGSLSGLIAEQEFKECMQSRGFVWVEDKPRQQSNQAAESGKHGSFSGPNNREVPFDPNFDPYKAQGISRP